MRAIRNRLLELRKRLGTRHREARRQPPRASGLILGLVVIVFVIATLARLLSDLLSAG